MEWFCGNVVYVTASELQQKAACRMTGWTPASSYSSQQQQQHGILTPADDPWMLSLRHCSYLCTKDDRHLARCPRYDIAAVTTYEPPFVDCSSLFVNQHHQQRALQSTGDDDVSQLQNDSSSPADFEDTWTVREYQSLASHRRQHQLNYSS